MNARTKYLVLQLEQGKMKYTDVISKFPDLKDEIDEALKNNNTYDLIAGRTED